MARARRRGSLILAALALAAVGFTQAVPEATDAPLRIAVAYPTTDEHAAALATFDDTHEHRHDGGVELLLWPGDEARLAATGMRFDITVQDVAAQRAAEEADAASLAPLPGIPGGTTDYRDLHEMYAELDALEAQSTAIADLTVDVQVRPYRSFEGREIKLVEIYKGNGHDGRPVAFIDGIHHAREWPAAEYPMIFAHHLVENHDDPRVDALLRKVRVVVVPVVNVDGFVYSRSFEGTLLDNSNLGIVAGGQGAYVRKTQRNNPVTTTGVDSEVFYGVDPNRNYAYLWGATTGSIVNNRDFPLYASTSFNPFDQTYHGHDSFTEPEVVNNREYFLANNVITYLSNHTSGRLVLRPWGHTTTPAPDDVILTDLGQSLADAMIGAGSQQPYENKIGLGLYPTLGTSNDWAYAATGTLGYVIEHSTSFHPPWNTGHAPGQVWPYAVEMFMRAAEAAADPAHSGVLTGTVTGPDGTPTGATLTLTRTFTTPYADSRFQNHGARASLKTGIEETQTLTLETAADGTFEWFLNPSTRPIEEIGGATESYTLTVETADGRSTAREIVLARGQTIELDLQVS